LKENPQIAQMSASFSGIVGLSTLDLEVAHESGFLSIDRPGGALGGAVGLVCHQLHLGQALVR
jgi:hypothetical protein